MKPMKKDDLNHDVQLLMHIDDELEQHEDRELMAALEISPTMRTKVAAMRELGELVRGHVELATDEAEPRLSGMWSELAKRFDNAVIPSPPAVSSVAPDGGFWRAVARWFERYRGHLLTGTLSAGAVAALTLLLRPAQLSSPLEGSGSRTAGNGTAPATFVSAPPEIESLDVPNGSGTVLTIDDDDGATAIVWVTPDDAEGI